MNSTVKADIVESLGGLDDTISPMEKSLRMHEMRPFDLEPNYYNELMANRSFIADMAQNAQRGRTPPPERYMEPAGAKNAFLERTISDAGFQKTHARIVSASPFRAIVRKVDPGAVSNEDDQEGTASPPRGEEEIVDNGEDDFDRGEEDDARVIRDNASLNTYNTAGAKRFSRDNSQEDRPGYDTREQITSAIPADLRKSSRERLYRENTDSKDMNITQVLHEGISAAVLEDTGEVKIEFVPTMRQEESSVNVRM